MNHTNGNDTTAMMIALVFVPRRSAFRRVLWFVLSPVFTSRDPKMDARTPTAASTIGMITAFTRSTSAILLNAITPSAHADRMEPT